MDNWGWIIGALIVLVAVLMMLGGTPEGKALEEAADELVPEGALIDDPAFNIPDDLPPNGTNEPDPGATSTVSVPGPPTGYDGPIVVTDLPYNPHGPENNN